MDSDEQAWNLLAALSTLTALTLLLVVVDKPFRDPERPDDNDILTLADKLFIFSQVSQLVNYCIAAMCMMDEAQRMAEDGQRGTSDGVAMAAEVIGFILVGLQVMALAGVYFKEWLDGRFEAAMAELEQQQQLERYEATQQAAAKEAKKTKKVTTTKVEKSTYDNPMMADLSEEEAEEEASSGD